ncbi:uncharacterized protein LOC110943800 [Helianthus annuus]|uniref:uncharacterized protein LOC110943800 n=1 Tax=Helianthus annuus TaxID=4232 RepID=UPI000B9001F3|nr:uncharacterized protein LOC110943800 [Helianthus annuus]
MEELKNRLMQFRLTSVSDKWVWKNDDKHEFTVKSVRCTLASQLNLNEDADSFMWNNWTTNKCSMFVWRAVQGRIPTTTQLRQRGMQISSIICKVCGREDETPDHVLVKCDYAKEVWEQIWNWVKISGAQKPDTIKEMIEAVNDFQWPKVKKKAVHAVFILTAWRIWKNRNTKVFKDRGEAAFKIIEDIKEESYQWMKQRTKIQIASWEEWKYFSWNK